MNFFFRKNTLLFYEVNYLRQLTVPRPSTLYQLQPTTLSLPLVSGLIRTASLPSSNAQPSSTYSLTSSSVNMSTLLGVGAGISSVADRSAAVVPNTRSLAHTFQTTRQSDLLSCFLDHW